MDRKVVTSNSPNLSNEDIYVNVTVHNDTNEEIFAEYRETKTQPILLDQSLYKMSIIRFDMPATGFPLFIYKNDMTVTLQNNFLPDEISSSNVEIVPINFLQNGNPLEVRSIYQLLTMINKALEEAYDNINSLKPASPPYFTYNSESKLIALLCNEEYSDVNDNGSPNIDPTKLNIYVNHILFNKVFPSFNADFFSYANPDGLDYRFIINRETVSDNTTNADFIIGPPPPNPDQGDLLVIKQAFSTTGLLFDFYKILITSNNMSVRKENVNTSNSSGKEINVPLITDFTYSIEDLSLSRIEYIPSAEFRFIDLLAHTELSNIGFKVNIQTLEGDLLPVKLLPGENMNLKILFRRK